MPAPAEANRQLSRTRILLAFAAVAATVLAVWTFIDYRTQPPAPPAGTVTSNR